MKYISCKELAHAHETFNVLVGMQDEVEVVDENGEPMEFMTKLIHELVDVNQRRQALIETIVEECKGRN